MRFLEILVDKNITDRLMSFFEIEKKRRGPNAEETMGDKKSRLVGRLGVIICCTISRASKMKCRHSATACYT